MTRGKNRSRQSCRQPLIPYQRQHPIVQQGIECHLLQQAKREVTPHRRKQTRCEMPPRTQQKADHHQHCRHGPEHRHSPPRRRPKVVCPPPQGLRRIAMQQKAHDQPHREYHPGPSCRELQPPDKPQNERRQENYVSKG
jgi:hypothetical protein